MTQALFCGSPSLSEHHFSVHEPETNNFHDHDSCLTFIVSVIQLFIWSFAKNQVEVSGKECQQRPVCLSVLTGFGVFFEDRILTKLATGKADSCQAARYSHKATVSSTDMVSLSCLLRPQLSAAPKCTQPLHNHATVCHFACAIQQQRPTCL